MALDLHLLAKAQRGRQHFLPNLARSKPAAELLRLVHQGGEGESILSAERHGAPQGGTLEEKAMQVEMYVPANTRLGIPACNWWSEAIHGVGRAGKATVFPQAIAMGATWDPDLVHRIAQAIADEARAKFDPNGERYRGLMLWCPTVNLARDPRWGRIEETYGEDPCLTARLGVAFVKGLQGDDPKYLECVATPKHLAMHSQETGRTFSSFDCSEATLRDYYFPAFYACFTEGHATSTMAAHNGINKVPCTMNHWLLTDVLRGEWGFDGAVVTDWGAVNYLWSQHRAVANREEAVAAAIKAGVDVLCDPQPLTYSVVGAVQDKLLPLADLDQAVTRDLTLRFRLGMFDPPDQVPFTKIPPSVVGSKEHLALALQTARESFVLLRNDPAPPGYGFERLLPLDLPRISSIAIVGLYAARAQFGNYSGDPAAPPVAPLDGLLAAVGPRVRILSAVGADDDTAVKVAASANVAVVVLGLNEGIEAEGIDKQSLDLPPRQLAFLKRVVDANPVTILVLEGGSPLSLQWESTHVPAIVMTWYPGEQGGTALAEILLGKVNPSGRLPLTFYHDLADVPPLRDYEISNGHTYMYLEKTPTYPFGYGLSYTTFAYSNLRVEPPAIKAGATITVTCDVANTGSRDGDEVVQLYVHKKDSPLKRPLKQLKAFQRINIPAGQTRTVQLTLKADDLAFWDTPSHKYVLEPGPYELLLGASSSDIRLQTQIEAKSAPASPRQRLPLDFPLPQPAHRRHHVARQLLTARRKIVPHLLHALRPGNHRRDLTLRQNVLQRRVRHRHAGRHQLRIFLHQPPPPFDRVRRPPPANPRKSAPPAVLPRQPPGIQRHLHDDPDALRRRTRERRARLLVKRVVKHFHGTASRGFDDLVQFLSPVDRHAVHTQLALRLEPFQRPEQRRARAFPVHEFQRRIVQHEHVDVIRAQPLEAGLDGRP